LPGKEIKLNDTWTGEWVWESKTSAGWQRNTFTTVYRALEEVQKIGLACLRIETLTKEKMEGQQEFSGRAVTLSGEADLKGEVVFAYKKGIIVEKSYVEDGGKLVMEITSPQAVTITNTNYARASFLLIR
jgi:hypothetical protein